MTEAIDVEKFYERLEKIQSAWLTHRTTAWESADALCICYGSRTEDLLYSKFSSFHVYLFGYEFPDSIILITKNEFYFMASAKKCSILEPLKQKESKIQMHLLQRGKDEGQNREFMHTLVQAIRKTGGKNVGSLYKNEYLGTFIPSWFEFISSNQLDKVEIASALGQYFATKDESEMELSKRASLLSNKVLKHGFVSEMETILDKDDKVSHTKLADKLEAIITDPNLIGIKVSKDFVEICYSPVIQSGGKYDIRVSAASTEDNLSPDVIICSLGARYKSYCANISRTFLVDVPPKVEQTYNTLLGLYNTCLEAMVIGNELKDVYEAAQGYLNKKNASLIAYLPKSFGFAIGIEFRDPTLVLNAANSSKFVEDMVFNLSVGFHNVPLTGEDKAGSTSSAIKKLNVFSLLLGDTVRIMKEGAPDILTKFSKEYSDISYNISDKNEEENKDGEGNDDDAGDDVDYKRKIRPREQHMNESLASDRTRKQKEIIEKRLEEARRRTSKGKIGKDESDVVVVEAKDLKLYSSPSEFPRDIVPNQVRIDMEREALFIPINGSAVPFHISVIKNVVLPGDVKNVSYLRINFYTPGGALAKDVPKNTQLLVAKYGSMVPFVKEITLRSMNPRHFSNIHMQYQELRKRVRQREQKAEQEKDLVTQAKLIKIKDQRIPRLQDVKLFPPLSGQKCIGTIEAHQNGLRFTSTKGEALDVLYSNIKHAIYQPCDKTTTVLLHFHLKDFIMIGKKKQKDVQFFTEVIDASMNLDNARRYSHDVDELDEEQREREMKKRLNLAFKEFATKLQKVAEHYDYNLTIDVPYKKVGFLGNPFREMVYIQPTANCIMNLTEKPPFIVTLSEVEHVHFERVTFGTRNFDLTFIFKNWDIKPRTITSIDIKSKEIIQDWLNLVEIPHTIGTRTMNWVETINIARLAGATFYENVDEDGVKKPAGWTFLSAEGDSDEEEDEEEDADSEFSGASESDDDDSEDDSESSFASENDDDDDEEDDDDDDDADEEEEEEEEEERPKKKMKR